MSEFADERYHGIMDPRSRIPVHQVGDKEPSIKPELRNLGLTVEEVRDAVTMPSHYGRFAIEPIHFLVENFGPGVLVSKIVKYSMRYDAKNGLEDLRKARRCLDMLILKVEGDPDWWKAPDAKEAGA